MRYFDLFISIDKLHSFFHTIDRALKKGGSMAKKAKKSSAKVHHKVAHHLEKPVDTLLGYTIILMFLVATLVILATYL